MLAIKRSLEELVDINHKEASSKRAVFTFPFQKMTLLTMHRQALMQILYVSTSIRDFKAWMP